MKPKHEIGKILSETFQYWLRTLRFQFLFSLVYFGVLFFSGMYAFRYYGLFKEVNQFSGLMYTDFQLFVKKYETLMRTENAVAFSMAIVAVKSVMFPLNIGFLKIYRKLDLKKNPTMDDLFVGFRGFYFFIFAAFAFFWNFTNSSLLMSFPPLTLLWTGLFLLVPALVFFKNMNFFQALRLSTGIFQKNFSLIILAMIVAIIFSYSGFFMFGFGLMLTFPFWNAVIFVLYKHLIGKFED